MASTIKKHEPTRHHCYTLADLKPLIEQLGHEMASDSREDDREAVALTKRGGLWIKLDKVSGVMTVCTFTNTLQKKEIERGKLRTVESAEGHQNVDKSPEDSGEVEEAAYDGFREDGGCY